MAVRDWGIYPWSGGKWTEVLGAYWERARYRTNRSALNSGLDQNVQHRGAADANLARHVAGRASRLVQLHHSLADTLGRATFRDDGPASESSGRRTKLNGGVVGVLSQGHHKRLTRNITQMNVGVALREFLLEGFWLLGSWMAEVLCGLRRLVLGLGAVVAPTVAVIGRAVLHHGRARREGQVQHCGRRCVDRGPV